MNCARGLTVAALMILLVAAGVTRADEEDIAISKLPKAVVEGIKAKYPDAKLLSAEKEPRGTRPSTKSTSSTRTGKLSCF